MAAVKFFCDAPKCANSYVTCDTEHTSGYLDLVEAGWRVVRLYNGWKHLCPDHRHHDVSGRST